MNFAENPNRTHHIPSRSNRILHILGIFLCSVLGACLVHDSAHAQSASVRQEGGLGSGNLRLSPGLSLEGGYDSNVFFEDEQENPSESFLMNVVGKFGVFTARPSSVYMEANAGITYTQYFNDDDRVLEQSGVSLQADGLLKFNPNGSVALSLYDNIQRTNEAPNSANLLSYNRIRNTAGATLHIQPGGKLLTLDIGGSYTADRNAFLDALDRDVVGLGVQGNWKFLPKTALIARYDQRFITYNTQERDPVSAFGADLPVQTLQNVDSSPYTVEGGLSGLITDRISVVAMAGYTNTNHDSGDSFSGFSGRFEGSYELTAPNRFTLGYSRSANDSSFGNFVSTHSFYSRYNHLVGSLVNLDASISYDLQQFSTVEAQEFNNATITVNGQEVPATTFSTNNREDPLLAASVGATFQLYDIWRIGARYQADYNGSDFQMITASGADNPESTDDINLRGVALAGFVKHRFFLSTGVEW